MNNDELIAKKERIRNQRVSFFEHILDTPILDNDVEDKVNELIEYLVKKYQYKDYVIQIGNIARYYYAVMLDAIQYALDVTDKQIVDNDNIEYDKESHLA
jgi:hypothetical protein